MNEITPHLWFDKEAKESSKFYVSLFPNSKITSVRTIEDTPSGECDIVSFELAGQSFVSMSAGPIFKLNPSISFMVNFDPSRDSEARKRLDSVWEKLAQGGKVLMPLEEYPFSERYGWIQDRFGLSWQLILTRPQSKPLPVIVPTLLFVGEAYGKAEEAVDYYLSVFSAKGGSASGGTDSKLGTRIKYPAGALPNKEGTVMFSDFTLSGSPFAAMDGGGAHTFKFTEAFSFAVSCDTQEEIDYFWGKLSAVPVAEQCGWLKDTFGVSWQIVPSALDELLSGGSPEQSMRVTQAFLRMKKFDIAKLQKAYEGK